MSKTDITVNITRAFASEYVSRKIAEAMESLFGLKQVAITSCLRTKEAQAALLRTMQELNEEKTMLYEVAAIELDRDEKEIGVALVPTAVLAKDRDAAIVAAAKLLPDSVDTDSTKVLVRRFQGE